MDDDIARAVEIAARVHAGQIDKGGEPYLLHPLRLMMKFQGRPIAMQVAVLHDVIEDSDMTLDDLLEAGFCRRVVSAVDALTRRKGESYDDFINRTMQDGIASDVKIADLEDNLDCCRLEEIGAADVKRLQKYLSAREALIFRRVMAGEQAKRELAS